MKRDAGYDAGAAEIRPNPDEIATWSDEGGLESTYQGSNVLAIRKPLPAPR
jgi:hypothetical protein